MHEPTSKKVGIIGAVNARNGKLIASCEEGKFNAQTIGLFFEELIKHREIGKTMVIVLDNTRFHHAKALSGWLKEHSDYFHLEFLPLYSLELNHIEQVWELLRRLCTHNQYFAHLEALRRAVFPKIIEWASPNDALKSLCAII